MNKIKELIEICNSIERFRIAMMLNCASDYVRAVANMEIVAANVADLAADEFKEEREATDRVRSAAHNAFIASVDEINKICNAHGVPHVYTGGSARREYGDFAMELVANIFVNRH